MATAIAKAYDVVALEDIEPGPEHDGRVPLNIRRHFGIQGFGVRANRAVGDGHVVGEHTEDGIGASGQEELYLVLSGKATFNVDGEPIYATAGTMVFVRDPAAQRSAIAKEEGTTILAIGGTPGEPIALGGRGDARHVGALPGGGLRGRPRSAPAGARGAAGGARPLQRRLHGGEARRTDDAISHLEQAIEDDDRIKEHIRTDGDLDSLREDPRFKALTG